MKYGTKITSKGTITIASPIRKILKLKAGQEVELFINKNKNIEIDTGVSMDEFVTVRDEVLKKVTLPPHLKGLTIRQLQDAAAKAWVSDETKKS
jgi:bifunctional DNA-binding transcriptional regulator/antitoxin component of YhaV-PrlF toxin-antitoxin module